MEMRDLSKDRKLALNGIYDSNGFQSMLDVLENITLDSEDELIGEPPDDSQKVLALHAIAYAHRAMLTMAVNQIDVMIAEFRQGEKKDTMEHRKLKSDEPSI